MTNGNQSPAKAAWLLAALGAVLGLAACSGGGGGGSASESASASPVSRAPDIIITPPGNRAPQAVGTLSARTLSEDGSTQNLDVAAYFRDPEGDPLTYTAQSGDPRILRVAITGSTMALTPVSPGNVTVTVSASDGHAQAVQSVAVTVHPAQSRPALVSPPPVNPPPVNPPPVNPPPVNPPSVSPPPVNPREDGVCRIGLQLDSKNTSCIHEMPFFSFRVRDRFGNGIWTGFFSGAVEEGWRAGETCMEVSGFVATRAGDSETWTIRAISGSSTCADFGF